MTTLQKIIDFEMSFPKNFADVKYTNYGVLFYNADNFNSNDSNHAIIISNDNFDRAIKNIKEFYLSENLCPRIYGSLVNGQLDKLDSILVENGFTRSSAKKNMQKMLLKTGGDLIMMKNKIIQR